VCSECPHGRRLRVALTVTLTLVCLAACASSVRPFPAAEPMWRDDDMRPFAPRPADYDSPFAWDGADQMLFRPLARFFAVDPAGDSVNVNAFDEVPDSSFFENRIGLRPMSPEEFARGSCGPADVTPVPPWTVTGAKPNGQNPGFLIKDASGRRFLLKFDGLVQPERATSADVIGSILYHAAGYHAPCNRIVQFERGVLRIDSSATSEDSAGNARRIVESDVDLVLSKAVRLPDGRFRASASLFLPGRPIGPFRYEGTRDDDPNDVVPHEDRRELRGGYVLAAWLNHFDAREQNTLDVWIETGGGRGYVRHYYLDFGDCFGSLWDWDGISRRLGPSGYFKLDHIARDLVTLGLAERPWETARFGRAGAVFGYFGDPQPFDPDAWFPGYPNPAFSRRQERDSAWMARILARIGREHLRAAVAEAKFSDPSVARELMRVLLARRERILRRFLSSVSPLTQPQLSEPDQREVCLSDLATYSGIVPRELRQYRALAYVNGKRVSLAARAGGLDRVCAPLPRTRNASARHPVYVILDVRGEVLGREEREGPARVHLYDFGPDRAPRIAGLERPERSEPP
jgi:hypothetical protein